MQNRDKHLQIRSLFYYEEKKNLGYLRRKRNKKIQKTPCLVNTNYLKKLVTSFDFEHYQTNLFCRKTTAVDVFRFIEYS